MMVDYLTYYYSNRGEPFQSLSALPDLEAIHLMEALYREFEGSLVFERFKDPVQYLQDRRETEQWVRQAFIAKGGTPQEAYPVCMVLGNSPWIERLAPDPESHAEIRIPLAVFREGDVSFTYPDSMISRWFGIEKPSKYYQPELHGKVFTRSEILSVVEARGLPEEAWDAHLPDDLAPYIEAQVWNHTPLLAYRVSGRNFDAAVDVSREEVDS